MSSSRRKNMDSLQNGESTWENVTHTKLSTPELDERECATSTAINHCESNKHDQIFQLDNSLESETQDEEYG